MFKVIVNFEHVNADWDLDMLYCVLKLCPALR